MNFLNKNQVLEIESKYTLPVYVYSEEELKNVADDFLNFPSAF
jgi:diaminopimelate decarboxylase